MRTCVRRGITITVFMVKMGLQITVLLFEVTVFLIQVSSLGSLQVSGQPRGAFPKPYNYSLDHMDCSEWDYDYDFQCYFLYQHRADLYQWIDLRCEQMVAGISCCHCLLLLSAFQISLVSLLSTFEVSLVKLVAEGMILGLKLGIIAWLIL